MNEIERQVIQSIDIIVEKKMRELNFDKTIKAIILSLDASATGQYLVQYQDSKFAAYSSKLSYQVGDSVFVLIPRNDFALRKTITGLANDYLLSAIEPTITVSAIEPTNPAFGDLWVDIS